MCVDHARSLITVATDVEKTTIFPSGRGIPPVVVFVWAINEAEKLPDPRQCARWYNSRSRRCAPPVPVKDLIIIVVAVPAPMKQVIVHSDSEGERSEDEEGDEPSEGEEEPGADVVVVEDDREEDPGADVLVVEDDNEEEQVAPVVHHQQLAPDDLQMVVLGIPQLSEKSMPIKVETYVRVGIRHSDYIKKMKEMQK